MKLTLRGRVQTATPNGALFSRASHWCGRPAQNCHDALGGGGTVEGTQQRPEWPGSPGGWLKWGVTGTPCSVRVETQDLQCRAGSPWHHETVSWGRICCSWRWLQSFKPESHYEDQGIILTSFKEITSLVHALQLTKPPKAGGQCPGIGGQGAPRPSRVVEGLRCATTEADWCYVQVTPEFQLTRVRPQVKGTWGRLHASNYL